MTGSTSHASRIVPCPRGFLKVPTLYYYLPNKSASGTIFCCFCVIPGFAIAADSMDSCCPRQRRNFCHFCYSFRFSLLWTILFLMGLWSYCFINWEEVGGSSLLLPFQISNSSFTLPQCLNATILWNSLFLVMEKYKNANKLPRNNSTNSK